MGGARRRERPPLQLETEIIQEFSIFNLNFKKFNSILEFLFQLWSWVLQGALGVGGGEGAVLAVELLTRRAVGDSGAGCRRRRQADVSRFCGLGRKAEAPLCPLGGDQISPLWDFQVLRRATVNHVIPGKCAQACRLLHFPGLLPAACSLVGCVCSWGHGWRGSMVSPLPLCRKEELGFTLLCLSMGGG